MALIYGLDLKYIHDDTWYEMVELGVGPKKHLQCMWTKCDEPSVLYFRSCGCDTDDDTETGCDHHGLTPVCTNHMFNELSYVETEIKARYLRMFPDGFAFSA